ncbi:MAG: hypothetical protein WAM14_17125 [Candidatus Nitrosopolaris sp.]
MNLVSILASAKFIATSIYHQSPNANPTMTRPTITVKAEIKDSKAFVSVKDTGQGIHPSYVVQKTI